MSAVQFNLLPDVKLEYNRAQHQKRTVYGLSALACVAVLVIFIISFLSVDVLQKKLLNDANNDITNYSQKLKSIPNIEKILTVQNQLGALPSMHQNKHVASRLFSYLPEITPDKINLGKLTMDTTANTIEFVGTSDTVETVNKFVDTLKFTTYTVQGSSKPAFSNVILTKVDRNDQAQTTNDRVSYTIDASFDPALFAAVQAVQLTVPQETTTRSVLNAASSNPIFNGETGKKSTQQGGQ